MGTVEPMKIGAMRALTSLISRANLSEVLGRTFRGKRDFYKVLGYKKELAPEDYRFRYRRGGIAGRIVDAYPKSTWRGTAELIEDETTAEQTPFEKEWTTLDQKLKIWANFLRTDVLAGLGEYSILLIGARGSLNSELPDNLGPDGVKYLTPFSQQNAEIGELDTRLSSERYGQPSTYIVKLADLTKPGGVREREVHWSRVIHFADGALDDPLKGTPRLEGVWNLLDDLDKITGGGAEAFWLRAHQGYHFNLDPEMVVEGDEEEALDEEADAFVNGMSRIMRTRGMEVKALGSDVAIFDKNVLSVVSQISGRSGIPQRILLGSEQGQLASEQDRVNWAERVHDRRVELSDPFQVRVFADRMIKYGALSKPDGYNTRWPAVFDLSDGERAKIANTWADINQKNKRMIVKTNEFRDRILGLPAVDEKDVELIESAAPNQDDNNQKLTNPVKE